MSQWPSFSSCILLLWSLSCSRPQEQFPQTGTHVVQTEEGFELSRNGKAFHIMGVSGEAVFLPELAAIGGNTIRFYDTLSLKENLDAAHMLGLAVVVDLPIPRYVPLFNVYASEENRQNIHSKVLRTVNRYKDHPALLFWMLGNEVEYPFGIFSSEHREFRQFFNKLIDDIHSTDPAHPISTAIQSVSKKRILSLTRNSPKLDFISLNVFGHLPRMDSDFNKLSIFWKGPFLISEWGDEGPWTLETTRWGAPMEPTASKKAERLLEKYEKYITMKPERNLGSLAFYWGQKQERTHTWFSLFDEKGNKTPSYHALKQLFSGTQSLEIPQLEYMIINGRGQQESLVLRSGTSYNAEVYFKADSCDSLVVSWELYPDIWNEEKFALESKPECIQNKFPLTADNAITFEAPSVPGSYRLFVYLKDHRGNTASANTPFYVINPDHETK